MKRIVQRAHLHIYQPKARITASLSRMITAKGIDTAVIAVSVAGLLSAFAFLITMS